MIAVILDSNTLHGDPFMRAGQLKRLLSYSAINGLDILVSEVVVEEVVNNNLKNIVRNIQEVRSKIKTINGYMGGQSLSLNSVDIDLSETQLRDRYSDLAGRDLIKIIPYKNEMMPELLRRALQKIRPFKENKEEFRDSVIWLSCIDHLKRTDYQGAFFVTNNSSDFCASKENSELHDDLKNDYDNLKLYRDLGSLFKDEKSLISSLIPHESHLKLGEWLSENHITQSYVQEAIGEYFLADISSHVSACVAGMNLGDFDRNFFPGYVQASEVVEFDVQDFEVEIDIDSLVVTGTCYSCTEVELFQYNPVHDTSDEKYTFLGDRVLSISTDFMFAISPDRDQPYDFDVTCVVIDHL